MAEKRSQMMLVEGKTKALEASNKEEEDLIGRHGTHEEHPLKQPTM